MRICVRVHRMPPMKEASSTIRKPCMLNWVDSKVNMNRPLEISTTTTTRYGFWRGERGRGRRRGRHTERVREREKGRGCKRL